jgi:hypothetical protein
MQAIALESAMESHATNLKHPNPELLQALEHANRAPAHRVGSKKWKTRTVVPPHPHALTRPNRGRVAENARNMMKEGIDVYRVAMQMGLTKPQPEPSNAKLASTQSEGVQLLANRPASNAQASRFMEALHQLEIARKVLAAAT